MKKFLICLCLIILTVPCYGAVRIKDIATFEGKVIFTKDKLNTGLFTFKNGDSYEGNFTEGIIKDEGVYTYANKSTLEGVFNDIDFSGEANLLYDDNKPLFKGTLDGKYITKQPSENIYFDGKLSGNFYNETGNSIFTGNSSAVFVNPFLCWEDFFLIISLSNDAD